jgi:outer membrane protein OmpA-like peptidoglycan-associated protein
MKITFLCLLACTIAQGQPSQAVNPTQRQPLDQPEGGTPLFRVTVVARTTKAINYHHRSGSTMVGLEGTALMPEAKGEAKVESRQGVIKIDANMSHMTPATSYGPEYLTYVMWAITPEGRATNLGEILLNNGKSKLNATSELQSFALIVTAEPYFAVTQPSDVVVMENFVRKDTTGTIEQLEAKYELLPRGQYVLNGNAKDLQPIDLNKKVPLELYEARNAVQIARWAGAARYAADTFHKAEIGLENAEGYLKGKGGKKPIGTVAREAVQMAEDARIITLKKLQEESLAKERAQAAAREARAQQETVEEARRRSDAEAQQKVEAEKRARAEAERESAQMAADRAKTETNVARAATSRAIAEADRAKAEAEAARLSAQEATERAAKQKADLEQTRAAALKQQQDAQAAMMAARSAAQEESDRAARERAQLEEARNAALKQEQLAKAETEKANRATEEAQRYRQQAESEKEHLRAQLLQQLNVILETRDSARGLIVNMSDVLFDTGQYSLRPGAREKLAKVAGIILGHPGLKIEVEGHTDSVGGESFNQQLSEQRSGSVRDYLIKQGLQSASITAVGFGKSRPVASNDTAAGRQQNRRVELVVSGEILGNPVSPR